MPSRIPGTAFFPGGSGLWGTDAAKSLPRMPVGGIMVLGQDFDSERGFCTSLARQSENLKGPTWRQLLSVLRHAGIDAGDCFFTNFFMGLRAGTCAIGRFPGARDAAFVRRCQRFLQRQIDVQRPRLILTLGAHVLGPTAELSPQLVSWVGVATLRELDARQCAVIPSATFGLAHTTAIVAMTHPSLRSVNVRHRRYADLTGDAAEQQMLLEVLGRRSGEEVPSVPRSAS